jgi:hypothetical protein
MQEEITLFKDRIPSQLIQPPRKLLDSPGSGFVFHDVSKEKLSAQVIFKAVGHAPLQALQFQILGYICT